MTVRGLYPYLLRKISVCSFLFVFLCIVFDFACPSLFVRACVCVSKKVNSTYLPTYPFTHLPPHHSFFLFTPSLAYLLAHRLSGSQSCVRWSLATLREQGSKSTPQATWCTSVTWVSWLRKANHPKQSCGVTMGNGLETSSNAVSV